MKIVVVIQWYCECIQLQIPSKIGTIFTSRILQNSFFRLPTLTNGKIFLCMILFLVKFRYDSSVC